MTETAYPVKFSIDYPDKPLNRVTTFFRIFMAIPIFIIWGLMGGPSQNNNGTLGLLFFPTILMLLFKKKYPKWWFDWNLELTRFFTRILAYLALLRDEYPSTDEEQAIHVDIYYPDASKLSRGLPLVKWFLAIPHYIVLYFLFIAAMIVTIVAWFAILFTGVYPRGMFDFVVGVYRWSMRVNAYAFILTTDEYPPFSLD